MRKGALLEMKMRCADPAGFPSKWRHVISMHSDGRRRPQAPLFNYATIRRGACDGSGEAGGCGDGKIGGMCGEGRQVQQASQDGAPLAASSGGDSPARRRRKSLAWRRHTRVHTQTCARRHTSTRLQLNPCRTCPELSRSLLCCFFNFLFFFFFYTLYTQTQPPY